MSIDSKLREILISEARLSALRYAKSIIEDPNATLILANDINEEQSSLALLRKETSNTPSGG